MNNYINYLKQKIRSFFHHPIIKKVDDQFNNSHKDNRRRVIVKLTGEVGTVYATYDPDYSAVMIDGLTKLQAFRESEILTFNKSKNT